MPLATKNGSLILKDGKIAENCGCCGGWYCYDGAATGKCFCVCEDPLKTLPNVLVFACVAESWNPPAELSGWPNPDTQGSVQLYRVSGCTSPRWEGQYTSGSQTIAVRIYGVNLDTDTGLFGEGLVLEWNGSYTGLNSLSLQQSYSNTLVTSGGGFAAGSGKSALKDLCDGVVMPAYAPPGATYSATVVRGD